MPSAPAEPWRLARGRGRLSSSAIAAATIFRGTGLQPYVFGALNSKGDTNFAAAGLSWKFGDRFYVRPGIGLAVHNGSTEDFIVDDRIAFGSRILFEPELGIGARINDRMTSRRAGSTSATAHCSAGRTPASTISARG